MTPPRDAWRELRPDLHHLGDGPAAIVEHVPARDEWHWRCPGVPAGGVAETREQAKRAARRALRQHEEPAP